MATETHIRESDFCDVSREELINLLAISDVTLGEATDIDAAKAEWAPFLKSRLVRTATRRQLRPAHLW